MALSKVLDALGSMVPTANPSMILTSRTKAHNIRMFMNGVPEAVSIPVVRIHHGPKGGIHYEQLGFISRGNGHKIKL